MTKNEAKIDDILSKIMAAKDGPEILTNLLKEKYDLHIFKGMTHMFDGFSNSPDARHFIILDTETTGLDHKKDDIIQLSMLKVEYDDDGILGVTEQFFDQFQDPGYPIPAEITALTGITDEKVKGQTINVDEIEEFISGADFILAHHAAFDRKFVEAKYPTTSFSKKNWACSIDDVDWKSRMVFSPKLELVVKGRDYVYPAHNAKADCTATGFVLKQFINDGPEPFKDILAALNSKKVMILAEDLPFDRKDTLKNDQEIKWRWSSDVNGEAGAKCWYTIVNNLEQAEKAAESVRNAYGSDVKLRIRNITPDVAFSERLPKPIRNGFESHNPKKLFGAQDIEITDGQINLSF